jgi:hypothetical protein
MMMMMMVLPQADDGYDALDPTINAGELSAALMHVRVCSPPTHGSLAKEAEVLRLTGLG